MDVVELLSRMRDAKPGTEVSVTLTEGPFDPCIRLEWRSLGESEVRSVPVHRIINGSIDLLRMEIDRVEEDAKRRMRDALANAARLMQEHI